jgi:glutaredoxin 3
MQAEIWTKKQCPYCVTAKQLLNSLNIPYNEFIVSPGLDEDTLQSNQRYVTRDDLLKKYPDAKTVPQIWIDGEHIGGCTDLQAEVAKGRFSSNK